MDGLSVAASCVALIQAADTTYSIISQFISDCKDAQSDLAAVSRELSALTRTLGLLRDLVPDGSEFADSDLTNNTKRDIREIIESSFNVATDIESVLLGHEGRLAAVSWAVRGKGKVATFKTLLETNRRALGLAVDTITLATAQNIKHDTTNILDDTTHIKGDIGSIMARIRNLEAMVSVKDPDDPRTYMLRRYLNDLSSVAGSVCDMSSRPVSPDFGTIRTLYQGHAASDTNDLTYAESKSSPEMTTSDRMHRDSTQSTSLGTVTPDIDTTEWAKDLTDMLHPTEQHNARSIQDSSQDITPYLMPLAYLHTLPDPEARPPMKSMSTLDVGDMEPPISKPLLKGSYVRIRWRQIIPVELNHLISNCCYRELSSDGTKLVWKPQAARPDMIYNIYTGEVADFMPLSFVRRIQLAISLWDNLIEFYILSTDASLYLLRFRGHKFKVYDRHTGKTFSPLQNQRIYRQSCILPISKDCSLFVLSHDEEGSWLVRVRRQKSSASGKLTRSQCQLLPQSWKVNTGHLTLSRHDQTITALDKNGVHVQAFTWRLHTDWFSDKKLVALPEIPNPNRFEMQLDDVVDKEMTIGFVLSGNTGMIITEDLRRSSVRITSWDLASGTVSFRQYFEKAELPGDGACSSQGKFFTGGRLSFDGRFLMICRAKKLTADGKTPADDELSPRRPARFITEIAILQVDRMRLIHRFEDKPGTISIFTPNFDVVARLSKDPQSNQKRPRTLLEVHELRESLDSE